MNYDAVVIGGGHNGLVCAAYLAGAGLKVRVLERRGIVGGAAVTEEFHPGFRNSTASYTVSLLNPMVIRDLRLHEHGLRVAERPYANFLPLPDARAFRLGGEQTQAEVARWSRRDAERYAAFDRDIDMAVGVLRELVLQAPPNLASGLAGLGQLLRAGQRHQPRPRTGRQRPHGSGVRHLAARRHPPVRGRARRRHQDRQERPGAGQSALRDGAGVQGR